MIAYFRSTIEQFVSTPNESIIGQLQLRYSQDGFASQRTQQILAWKESIKILKQVLQEWVGEDSAVNRFGICLEFPIYRLRKRLDVVLLVNSTVIVLEFKVGATEALAGDRRQVEEYALDLRDFHRPSHGLNLIPILCATKFVDSENFQGLFNDGISDVVCVGASNLSRTLKDVARFSSGSKQLDLVAWDEGVYQPVPNIIQAATSIFSGHDVKSIARADATNLTDTVKSIVAILEETRSSQQRALIFVTGVPGAGKTLVGLQATHDLRATGAASEGDIVYLSGNTPLVTVLRAALTEDEYKRERDRLFDKNQSYKGSPTKAVIERKVKTRIQHINDFLARSIKTDDELPPHEHAIVFDEAQRAWDVEQGKKKFGRAESEPELVLRLMGRHKDWSACICLIGGGQEINSGEDGLIGWRNALLNSEQKAWKVYAPSDVIDGGSSTGGLFLGDILSKHEIRKVDELQLKVPIRSYRSPRISDWVALLLEGKLKEAAKLATNIAEYPILVVRDLNSARNWLRVHTKGQRRSGLVASSGARRLRTEGLGETLNATDRGKIAHWYLRERGDIRSSYMLEVPANEYTTQGLELDRVGLCWGGDLIWNSEESTWQARALGGPSWKKISNPERYQYVLNKYRVLLTRAREGLLIYVPRGSEIDKTRDSKKYDKVVDVLKSAGVKALDS